MTPPVLFLRFWQCFLLPDGRSACSKDFHPHDPDTCRSFGIGTGGPALFWWMIRIMHSIYFSFLPYAFPFRSSYYIGKSAASQRLMGIPPPFTLNMQEIYRSFRNISISHIQNAKV